jgi:hypothetical protein
MRCRVGPLQWRINVPGAAAHHPASAGGGPAEGFARGTDAGQRVAGILQGPLRAGTAARRSELDLGTAFAAVGADVDARNRGGVRAWVACSNANASPIRSGSDHGPPMNDRPIGSGPTDAIGTVIVP